MFVFHTSGVMIKILFVFIVLFTCFHFGDTRHRQHRQKGRAADPKRKQRQFPICVDELNGAITSKTKAPEEKGLARFTHVFDFLKQNTYIAVSKKNTSPSGMIKIELSAVKIDDANSGYKDTLRNWVHIHITSEADLEAIYVQANSAPWGIPFGEFVADFDCEDCKPRKTSFYKDDIHIIPCYKRAALAYTHPNVFTIGGNEIEDDSPKKRTYFKDIHFNFRYTQYPCVEHTYAQFLIIAVRNFKGNYTRFETFYSQIYELDVEDNPTGAYYPFYYGWETYHIKCHAGDLENDFKPYSMADPTLKLRQSKVFDTCLLDTFSEDNNRWFTCPPGPIIINDDGEVPTTQQEWKDFRIKYELKGDPSVAEYGDNANFCPDSGTWDWTVGDLDWTLPIDIEVVIEPGTLNLTTVIQSQLPSIDGYECIETASKLKCEKRVNASQKQYCGDYHANDCSAQSLENTNTIPLFGKDSTTGNYRLKDVPCSSLNFTDEIDVIGISWGNKWVLNLHGKLMIFTWTVAWNVVAFTARFMKEYTVIERRSSYFGIGNWLWHHIIWTHIAWMGMVAGVFLMSHQHETEREQLGNKDTKSINLHDLCNLHLSANETQTCLSFERKIHNQCGVAACFFFFLSYVSAWGRPVNRFLRILVVSYHLGMAYGGKFIFYFIVVYGYLGNRDVVRWKTFIGVILIDMASLVMFIIATVYNCFIDRKFVVEGRRQFPIPEGLDTYDFPPKMQRIVSLILPVHIIIQLGCFFWILGTFETETNLCKRG